MPYLLQVGTEYTIIGKKKISGDPMMNQHCTGLRGAKLSTVKWQPPFQTPRFVSPGACARKGRPGRGAGLAQLGRHGASPPRLEAFGASTKLIVPGLEESAESKSTMVPRKETVCPELSMIPCLG